MKLKSIVMLFILLSPCAVIAGDADVVKVEITKEGGGKFRFDVTVSHGDEGWDHYADGWEVIGPDNKVLGVRKLLHPHNQQPFTRYLSGVEIPASIAKVRVRAHDKVHGIGGKEIELAVPH